MGVVDGLWPVFLPVIQRKTDETNSLLQSIGQKRYFYIPELSSLGSNLKINLSD